ncbi:MAG: hypothetical protein JRJ69_14380 [Deltaproteobacteria bacterium]|nr:hypothetical protein [Deltaproteobacteria bacterium]MBW1911059.1 hypothetical protein [Deltaproteobacteria bacterium]MBW2035222.1 hypothetical protein [Deltaproteobacteria bacterium]
MTKRERVILVLMFLVVAYGAYALFFSSTPKGTSKYSGGRSGELNKLITELSVGLTKEGPTETDIYIIEKAETKWVKDPFCEKKISVVKEKEEASKAEAEAEAEAEVLPEVTFSYSGYMEMGDRKIAIIDGMEYKTGEEIVPGGFVIRAIYPNKIVIGIKGKEEEITVPLVEEVL